MKNVTYKVSAYETEADFQKKKNATVDIKVSKAKAIAEINMLERGKEFYGATVVSSDKKLNKEFIFKK